MKHREKKRIIQFCKEKMEQAERNAERESIQKIEEYKKAEKHMFREMNKKRVQANDAGTVLDYTSYETKLQDLIVELKGALLDIEMALQQSLDSARASFF